MNIPAAAAYLKAHGLILDAETLEGLAAAFARPLAAPAPVDAAGLCLDAAERAWRAHAGEHDRSAGGLLNEIFVAAGWGSRGVPKGAEDKVPDWCGMFVAWCLLAGGANAAMNTSFLHTLNVEAFFTYGARANVNPRRLDSEVHIAGSWMPIRVWHQSAGALRRWHAFGPGAEDVAGLDIAPGDVLLIDWSLRRTDADHIALVRSWDGRWLRTFEGNRRGRGPAGEDWRESVVACEYDLASPHDLALVYGIGRLSPLDFGAAVVR